MPWPCSQEHEGITPITEKPAQESDWFRMAALLNLLQKNTKLTSSKSRGASSSLKASSLRVVSAGTSCSCMAMASCRVFAHAAASIAPAGMHPREGLSLRRPDGLSHPCNHGQINTRQGRIDRRVGGRLKPAVRPLQSVRISSRGRLTRPHKGRQLVNPPNKLMGVVRIPTIQSRLNPCASEQERFNRTLPVSRSRNRSR